MVDTELKQVLQNGIDAARVGRRDEAHALLMQVIEADEQNELAWFWLSGVVEDPADRRVCLENVLAINPQNVQAQRGLEKLAAQQNGATDSAPPAAASPVPVAQPAPPAAAVPPVDATQPCPFCGAETTIGRRRCGKCGNSLLIPGPLPEKRSIWLTILAVLWGMGALSSLLTTGVLFFLLVPLVQMTMEMGGDFPLEVVAVGVALLVYVGVQFAITIGLFQRQRWAFFIHLALLALQVLVVGLLLAFGATLLAAIGALAAAAGEGPQAGDLLAGLLSGGVSLIIMLLPFVLMIGLTWLSWSDFFRPQVRIVVTFDRRDPEAHYNMGVLYKNRGMWYMAAREWEGAVEGSPIDASYRHALGLAYARLKDYDRALATLNEAARRAPDDPQIAASLVTVERMVNAK